jgi:hypothetical protein
VTSARPEDVHSLLVAAYSSGQQEHIAGFKTEAEAIEWLSPPAAAIRGWMLGATRNDRPSADAPSGAAALLFDATTDPQKKPRRRSGPKLGGELIISPSPSL